eukprot:6234435-Pyramimonas_sp.AAC.1
MSPQCHGISVKLHARLWACETLALSARLLTSHGRGHCRKTTWHGPVALLRHALRKLSMAQSNLTSRLALT